MVEIGLTDLPKSVGGGGGHCPAPVPTALDDIHFGFGIFHIDRLIIEKSDISRTTLRELDIYRESICNAI